MIQMFCDECGRPAEATYNQPGFVFFTGGSKDGTLSIELCERHINPPWTRIQTAPISAITVSPADLKLMQDMLNEFSAMLIAMKRSDKYQVNITHLHKVLRKALGTDG